MSLCGKLQAFVRIHTREVQASFHHFTLPEVSPDLMTPTSVIFHSFPVFCSLNCRLQPPSPIILSLKLSSWRLPACWQCCCSSPVLSGGSHFSPTARNLHAESPSHESQIPPPSPPKSPRVSNRVPQSQKSNPCLHPQLHNLALTHRIYPCFCKLSPSLAGTRPCPGPPTSITCYFLKTTFFVSSLVPDLYCFTDEKVCRTCA